MKHAEQWLLSKSLFLKKIGLHVHAKNQPALKFYEKFGFSVYKTQFYKKIENCPPLNKSDLNFTRLESKNDLEQLKLFAFSLFSQEFSKDDKCEFSSFEKYFSSFLKEDKYTIYEIKIENTIAGFFIVTKSEMNYQDAAYLIYFNWDKTRIDSKFLPSMVNFVEEWARNCNIDIVETCIPNFYMGIIESLRTLGYQEFGYFMQKTLNN
jgi:hypothetical protein